MANGDVEDKDMGWSRIVDLLTKELAAEPHVLVGVREAAGAHEDEDGNSGELTIAAVALFNEYGTTNGVVPERSFLRSTVDTNRARYLKLLGVGVGAAIDGTRSMDQSFDLVGIKAVGDIQQAIADGIEPENADSTVERKGSSTPLIDSGQLRQAIDYEVRGKR